MSARLLLLLDGLGALLSAALLLALPDVGLPLATIRALALSATLMAAYSLTCCLTHRTGRRYLQAIATANTAYGFTTLALMLWHRASLTTFGLVYFVLELLILSQLIRLEYQGGRRHVPL